jgi:hypothetical protein
MPRRKFVSGVGDRGSDIVDASAEDGSVQDNSVNQSVKVLLIGAVGTA